MSDLAEMLKAQRALQVESFGVDPLDFASDEERVEYLRWNVLALTDELHEFLRETGWKPWATSRHVNVDLALKELTDAWHFFMNLLMAAASPEVFEASAPQLVDELAEEFATRYFVKREVNVQRQADGYTGLKGA